MPSMLNSQLNNLSKDVYSSPETTKPLPIETGAIEPESLKFSPEEMASRAIADAINDLPGDQEEIVSSSQKTLAAAENILPVEFENRNQRLEEILQNIKEWRAKATDDMPTFYKLVYEGAQELRRNGDFYSLDALHDGAVEIAKGDKNLLH